MTLSIRLPRIAAAVLAGGALAVAGVAFQALTRNPLAEPSVLGISAGAAFGVVVGQSFGLGLTLRAAVGLTAFAFAGALVAAGAVYLIAAVGAGLSIQTLLLAGVIVGIFFSAAITVVISLLDFNRLGGVVHWLLGNLAPIPPGALGLFAILSALGFALVVTHARELNLMALGEEALLQLGVAADRLKLTIFLGAALLTASVVAFVGPIGFVGLIVPHMLRILLGSGQPVAGSGRARRRRHLPAARRHPGPQHRRPRRALGRRHHLLLRRPVLHLPPPHPLPRQPLMPTPVTPTRPCRNSRASSPGRDGAQPPRSSERVPRGRTTPPSTRRPAPRRQPRSRMTLVEFRNVSFAYPASGRAEDAPVCPVRPLPGNLAGEIIGVIGPNSSGKTTLIRLLTRVLEPAAGEIRLEGVPVGRLSRTDLARRVAVVPQGILPQFPFTVGELVLMGRYPHDPGRYFESPRDRAWRARRWRPRACSRSRTCRSST